MKSTLQIDSNPSYDKVDSYFKHLMAECEAMAVSASGVQTVTVTPRQDPRQTHETGAKDIPYSTESKDYLDSYYLNACTREQQVREAEV